MLLKDLKLKIENADTNYGFLIFKNSESDFISKQYCKAIAKNTNRDIEYVSDIERFYFKDPFDMHDSLYVYRVDELYLKDEGLEYNDNLIIVCNKVNKSSNVWYNNYMVEIPKIEEWQLKDYVYSNLEGINPEQLDWLINITNKNVDRLSLEVERINLFAKEERQTMFDRFVEDYVYSDLSQKTVFDLSNAIMKRDLNSINRCYKELDNIDFNIIGFIQILYNNFRNIILIQLSKDSHKIPEGMKQNQYYALLHSIGYYNREQLVSIFRMLTDIDKEIKVGSVDTSTLLDYVITFILGV